MSTMAQESGSIVAFEGAQDTVLTQLRLLPTSSQILILPSVQSYLPSSVLDQDEFDPTLLILKAHEAAKARHDTAAQFLQGSSPTNKRLVFLNGGTPSAHTLCVKEIMRNITRGDAAAAEALFNDLSRDGLAGLEAKGHEYRRRHHAAYSDPGSYDEAGEDPITKAMKAADALDRLTASLQTSNELDLTNNRVSRFPRRSSLPLYGYSDSFCDAAPFFVFGNRQDAVDDRARQHFSTAVPNLHLSIPAPQKQPSRLTFGDQSQFLSTHLDISNDSGIATPVSIAPSTACSEYTDTRDGDVEFGEAAILEMRSPVRKSSLKRVRSLDRMFPSSPQHRDPCFALELCGIDVNASKRFSAGSLSGSTSDSTSRPESIEAPRTITIGPKRPAVVTINPVPHEKKKKLATSYVDHATETDDVALRHADEVVLPTTENLVVYFKDEMLDSVLDSVISSIKDDSQCPLITSSRSSTSNLDLDSLPQTPESPVMQVSESKTTSRHWRERSVFSDDYDPYSYTHHQMPWYPGPEAQVTAAVQAAKLPTPQRSPRPSFSGEANGVHVFHVKREQSAISVQNSLRSILGGYFPSEARGYHQFQFAVLPEMEGLWKPIFRDVEANGSPRKSKRRMDLIMAVGSQRGVSKEFSSKVTAKLERLGVRRSGQTRSGRLDFRYLIANAMQAFTAQPLANQSCDNPFANPYLLATLLVPRLETYLAAHPAIRFLLLEFPPEHLPTVLALQKLVGLDLMKVAQVLDSSNENTGPFTHIRGASIASQSEKTKALAEAEKSAPFPTCQSDVSVSEANFLLMSTASNAEVDTFVSTIQAILERLSSFYKIQEQPVSKSCQVTQDLDLKPLPPIQRQNLPALQSNFAPYARRPSPELPLSAVMLQPPQLDSPTSVSTFSDTVPTPRSARSRFGRNWKSEQIPVHALDDDSDYDADERRLLPMFLQKPPKGNSRKALKFLGLA